VLKLYLDDSGKHEQSVGGCIADAKSWEAYESAWQSVLDAFHVEWFHAVDFEAPVGRGRDEHLRTGYSAMTHTKRDNLRSALADVLQAHIGIPIAEAMKGGLSRWGGYICSIIPRGAVRMKKDMKQRDREGQHGRRQPTSRRERFREDVISLSQDHYGHCLQRALYLAATEFALPLGETILSFVADQPKRNGLVPTAYEIAAQTPKLRATFAGLAHGEPMNPRRVIELQAADFAAYYLTKAKRDPSRSIAQDISNKLQPQRVELSDGLYGMQGYVE